MSKLQNARFDFKEDALFSGTQINRDRPVAFKLEGRSYIGFDGDTILSALLASGVDTAGEINGEEIALDAELSLPVVVASSDERKPAILPMQRTPIVPGMELLLFTPQSRLRKMTRSALERVRRAASGRSARSLDIDLAVSDILSGPWADLPVERELNTDLVVVGGGVSGLSAALAAAESGWAVTIVEQRCILGGDARFFGSQEGEQRPEELVRSLKEALLAYDNVRVFTNSKALSLTANCTRIHRVGRRDDEVYGEILRVSGRKTILATGTLERLPVFPGNRLPGVAKARASFQLAALYGLWRGKSAAFCTSSSAATQVALLAADMGIKVSKLADSRIRPKSRFFEFAKAYGISLATGTQAVLARVAGNGKLDVRFG
ncbi:MAG TPA: FAD-dependent oxidoreductase, partial [Devosia sp.]|nr:FAD-dependent oxidoreductase [Devosia sp.]